MVEGGALVKCEENASGANSTSIRFIPARNKFRMVMGFSKQIEALGFDNKINFKGMNVTGSGEIVLF